ncbi:MAG: hypothetical protein EU548_06140 [Promethearchaeota archaeon]|nr:MAG: hypothetical protein EU548_06140 [Candidatus Lokiarchaeota archaeon]
MKELEDIKIIISKSILDELVNCVKSAYPNEACGLIFGDKKEIQNPNKKEDYFYHFIGKIFHCFESDKKSPVAFLMENVAMLNKIYQEIYKKHKLSLISIFHSHPSGNFPSGVDAKNMKRLDEFNIEYRGKKLNNPFKNVIWVIMDASNKKMNSFIYINSEIVQTDIKIQK